MFEVLTEKFGQLFGRLRGAGKIRAKEIEEILQEVRHSLLDADVHYQVVQDFVAAIHAKAVGAEVLESLSPDQQLVKIVHEELLRLLGERAPALDLSGQPPTLMLVGLQGSGKTTSAGKLARYLAEQKGRRPYLVPADLRRPAAIEQLQKIGAELSLAVHPSHAGEDVVELCAGAQAEARSRHLDVVILDTAGRLAIDQPLMQELVRIKERVRPQEILLVVDAMTGQDAVNVASRFHQELGLSGVILTKLDGDARGGAALSVRAVTGCPIKMIGVGEKSDALEVFHPDRLAGRILGMGDMLSLIEKAQAAFEEKAAQALEEKLRRDEFTMDDFLGQMRQMKKLGPLTGLMEMLPGFGKVKHLMKGVDPERNLRKVEAIILSMTPAERANQKLINGSRRKRIAAGSGTKLQDVNQFLQQFEQMKVMIKRLRKMGMKGLPAIPGF